MLVAKEQFRYATSMEAAATDKVASDLNLTAKREDRSYVDVADDGARPKIDVRRVRTGFIKPKAKSQPATSKSDIRVAVRDFDWQGNGEVASSAADSGDTRSIGR